MIRIPLLRRASRSLVRGMGETADGGSTLRCDEVHPLRRNEVAEAVNDPVRARRTGQPLPTIWDGGAAVKLVGIRPDGEMATLGVRNGDVILSVDDLPVATPEQALVLYTHLRQASDVRVVLARDGVHLALCYPIGD